MFTGPGTWLGLLSLGASACGFSVASSPIDGGDSTTSSDASPDAPPGAACYGTSLVRVCFAQPPTGSVTLAGAISTDDDTSCTRVEPQAIGPSMCVIAAAEVVTGGTVVATGSRPLVLIADQTIRIAHMLDVSSTVNGQCGAGCDTTCIPAGNGVGDAGGGGGGAGGSFGSIGGIGATGDANTNGLPIGTAAGGAPSMGFTPTLLRGGCRGGEGGPGSAVDDGGDGGRGGGAVQLIAGTAISITGDIYASGAGGTISSTITGFQDGGGGGGSGGMIGLDAPAISIIGRVVANGGGGSGGGGNTGGGPGGDGTTSTWNTPAAGGTAGPTVAGPGGTGSAITNPSSINPPAADAGGGGGGGGLGVIWIDGPVTGGTMVSPPPTPH